MDSTELGIDPLTYLPAYETARASGFRLTAHQGENSPAAAIAAAIDALGVDRVDHGISIVDDSELVSRVVDIQLPLTVCPNSNVRIANVFKRLEDHVYPRMRAHGLLATLNTDDPALSDLDLGMEYRSVAAAFGWGWDEMVAIALDGVEACWLDDSDKAILRGQINSAAKALAPDSSSPD
jgi:adenosine deaminase